MRGRTLNMSWTFASVLIASFTLTSAKNATEISSHLPENAQVKERVDLNKTVLEVEKILDKYPELPRIDRSEILSILQNITEEDNEKLKDELTEVLEEENQKMHKSMNKGTSFKNSTRSEGNRSVMVVLPFHADDNDESLEELYTRSPIVMMEEQEVKETTNSPILESSSIKTSNPAGYSIVEKKDPKFSPPLRVIGFRYDSTPGPHHHTIQDSSKSYTNFQDPEQVTMAFRTEEVKTSNSWNHRDSFTTEKVKEVSMAEDTKYGEWGGGPNLKGSGFSQTFHEPDSMDNFSIEDAIYHSTENEEEEDEPVTIRNISEVELTTSPTTTSTTVKVFATTKKPNIKEEKVVATSTTQSTPKKKFKPKAKVPEKTTKSPVTPVPQDLANVLNNLPPHMKEIFGHIGIDESLKLSENTDVPPITPVRGVNAQIDPSSYHNFKPLPLERQKTVSEDMQQLLASFGLLEGNRQQKSAAETTTVLDDKYLDSVPKINPDFLTDTMKKTLDNLGLYDAPSDKQSRKHIFNPKNHTTVQSDEEIKKLNTLLSTIKKLAAFNESEPVTPEFQNEILQQVKDLDNITISYKTSAAINEEIHRIMENNKGKFKIPVFMKESEINTLQTGLNPEFYEEIQLKNEVKRQENSKSAGTSTEAPLEASSTTEPINSAALEDAFGGGETAPAGTNPAESLPPKRPNGLYFLLDWNTFFEVGTEDDSRRVNIRFQPKVGDGRNFLPVAIP